MDYYHVRLTPKSDPSRVEVRLDLNIDELTERFVLPYRSGLPITINGRSFLTEDVERIRINKTDQDSQYLLVIVSEERSRRASQGILDFAGPSNDERAARKGEDVTDDFITGPPGTDVLISAEALSESRPPTETRTIFVVFGRNHAARDALFAFLRSIGLEPLEWNKAVQTTGKPNPYIGEILDAAFSRAHAVLVLFTPDDEARLKESLRTQSDPPHETELTGQARPNVLFEAGMAMARDQDRTILVELGDIRPFSDIAGRHTIRLNNTSPRRQELAQRLQAAGCPVNLEGTDWHTSGDFEAAIETSTEVASETSESPSHHSKLFQSNELSEDAVILLEEAGKDRARAIMKVRTAGGLRVMTNGKDFVEPDGPRSEARWENAVRELVGMGLIEDPKGLDEVFEVTHLGFEFIDSLRDE